jgi:hypothetical protein
VQLLLDWTQIQLDCLRVISATAPRGPHHFLR